MPDVRHLYLHVPYCAAKCPYCDFNSIAGRDGEHAAYVAALLREVRALPPGPYDTIYLGGGTPTLLAPTLLATLLEGISRHLIFAPGYEWTCEANPGSADAERFAVMAEHGVNRVSLGVQSTNDRYLRFLGRVHDATQADRAITAALDRFPRVSADLIIGLPEQSTTDVLADLELYRRHGLDHASVYHLTYEPGTEFHARRARGEMKDIDVEQSRALFALVWDQLEQLGLLPYETSNFSRPGQESRHNLAYWRQQDYQAAGAGAVSTVAGQRLTREKHPERYITRVNAGEDAVWRRETIGPGEALTEAWMLGLRLSCGVRVSRLQELGDGALRWQPLVESLVAEGLLQYDGQHIRLTRIGRMVQDEVTVYLLPDVAARSPEGMSG